MKIWNSFCKTYVLYIKKKLRTCRIQIQEEKVWFLFKKDKKMYFFEFFLMSEQSKKIFFWFFQNFNFFLKNTPRGPRKCEKKQSHELWAYLERPQRCHTQSSTSAWTLCPPPPCSVGLISETRHWFCKDKTLKKFPSVCFMALS